MKVVIFGTGRLYIKNQYRFTDMTIVAFLDNDKSKQGSMINGVMIDKPENVINYDFDYVILASKFFEQMRAQMLLLGVPEEVILDRDHLGFFGNIRNVRSYHVRNNMQVQGKKVLLVTHDMGLTGAPIVLFNMAKVLKKNGYEVHIYAQNTGPLVCEFLKLGTSVYIFDEFDFVQEEIDSYFKDYCFIVINTVTLFELVHRVQSLDVSILWWLHEEDDIYKKHQITELDLCVAENVHIYGVSDRSARSYEFYSGKRVAGEIVYGIENTAKREVRDPEGTKVVFAIIGSVCERKGHDVLLQAISANESRWNDEAEFWIIGAAPKDYQNRFKVIRNAKVWGELTHEQVEQLYGQIDVVVCPSRNDPMPVVLAEGMMNKKLCITSDMTGTAKLITPYEDGLVCKAGDVDSLTDCIQWVLDHKEKMTALGEKSYRIYEKRFSMESFEKNVLRIVSEKAR